MCETPRATWSYTTSVMTSRKNALFSTEQHPVASPSMTAFLMVLSIAFRLAELVLPVWALTTVRLAFLLFLTVAPSIARADRRKPSTFCGLLLDRKPAHFYRRQSRWSDRVTSVVANDATHRLPWLDSNNRRHLTFELRAG